ncbi:hypothetical protein GCM10007416_33870 [Kroppenstedtia guangzhouensis]|uniref:Helix-turn-helix domain-containing protein n=1 Tax=Kroppenstedtia guangzhouensis TaxID=1274356 RepID=A0ABQ1H4H1_9BACL|nr:helix-turn-helix domain-containing protein [Kroppenstedtia guangzhouensis]GGA57897.1 hypothetical protein GCM10007416_33870 [Kroppenstedtia guangzhouensis]
MSDIMTPAQVAKRLQVTERTVYKYLANGEMEAVKIGRVWRITEEQLQKFIQKNTRKKEDK